MGLTRRFALIEPEKNRKKVKIMPCGESSLPAEADFRYLKFL
jgi:hypothetical protein